MMDKFDFKKTEKAFYSGKKGRWDRLTIPPMQFLMLDGQGDPGGTEYSAALAALYPLAYGIKFAMKSKGSDFVVPPLEALWWADDMAAFVAGQRDTWQWTVMIRMPDFVLNDDLAQARQKLLLKLAKTPDIDIQTTESVRLEVLNEGDSLQTLHVGPYADEAPVLAHLHHDLMPDLGLKFGGKHHEIYLGGPRRVTSEKLKTILRQPVQPTQIRQGLTV